MENLLQQLRSPSSKERKQKRGQATSVTLPLSAATHSLPSSGLKTHKIKNNNKKTKTQLEAAAVQLCVHEHLCTEEVIFFSLSK